MKRIHTAVAVAGALAASVTMAQSSVQVYGLVDTGIARITNASAAGDAMTKMPSLTGSLPSRIGFKGSEHLGNGLQLFFVLENGLSLDSGSTGQGGRLFGRAANIGLRGAWGALTLGRQNNMTYLAAMKADVMGPNLFSISSLDPYIPNARSDNAIGYLGNFNGIVVGATYSLGRDASASGGPAATNCAGEAASDSRACRQYTGLLGYESKGWGINASYDRMFGNVGAAGGLSSSSRRDVRSTVNAYVMLGASKIGAGVMDRSTHAAAGLTESMLYYAGASRPVGPVVVDAQVSRRDSRHSGADATLFVARVTYALSKRTAVYTSLGHIDNDGSSAIALDVGGSTGAGMAQNGLMAGLRHSF